MEKAHFAVWKCAEHGIICKPLDSAQQMMHIAIVFQTNITGRAKVAAVFPYNLNVRSTKLLSVFTDTSLLYEGTYLVSGWQGDEKP